MVMGSKPIYFNQSEQICPYTLSTALQGEKNLNTDTQSCTIAASGLPSH